MSVSAAEMEMRRQQMIASLHKVSAAMRECTQIIDLYTSAAGPNGYQPSFGSMPMTAMPGPMSNGGPVPVTATMHQTPPAVEEEKRKPGRPAKGAPVKEKKVKDPNAPKRPASAYINFQNDVREEIRRIHPSLPYKEVLTLIAEKWKNLPTEVKQKYEETYQEQSNAFKILDNAYKAGGSAPAAADSAVAAEEQSSEASESDSDSSDSDSTPLPATGKKAAPKPASQSTPQVSHTAAAAVSTPVPASAKKEKKRKNKEDEAPVAATPDASEKKKSKKKKDVVA